MITIGYEGTVAGFQAYALRELRKAALAGMDLSDPRDRRRLQHRLRRAMIRDLRDQIVSRPTGPTGGDVA